jgi:putative transposase
MPPLFFHKNIRLPATEYVGTKSFFVTLCSAGRQSRFTDFRLALHILRSLREQAVERAFDIHAYCLMPDHLHFLAQGTQPHCDLLDFVRAFRLCSSPPYSKATGQPLWQKKYFDHILRSSSSLNSVAWYIWMNPVRKGLASKAGEYSFCGSFTNADLAWKKPAQVWTPDWK